MFNQEFSRRGAAAQSKSRRPQFSAVSQRRCVKIFLMFLGCVLACNSVVAQKTASRFDPDGAFWIVGETPNDFSEFGAINLNSKRSRQLPVQGFELRTGKRLAFKTLTVKRDQFTFTTITSGGVSYAFAGKFLKGGVYSAGELDDETPVLEGTLTKFRGGQKVAEAKLKFSYFGGT